MADIFGDATNKPAAAAPAKAKGKGKSVEEVYQKVTQTEHILLRPDSYIGSTEPHSDTMWIYDKNKMQFDQRKVTYTPGLYKIYDEILVNAADNKQRDSSMNKIKIDIDRENNTISVWNNGRGIPVVMHKTEKIYVPHLIFGVLLTSSNYNDGEKKVTGGRNGFGAKLCNIFSTEFIIETCSEGKKYRQVFSDNNSTQGEAKITSTTSPDYTCVTFKPDLKRFNMTQLDEDIEALMIRRAWDVAACNTGVTVYLNGEKLPVKGFKDYARMYIETRGTENPIIHAKLGERWEVVLSLSEGQFEQMSFVNSIATTKGITHVNYIADQVINKVLPQVNKGAAKSGAKKAGAISSKQVKDHLWVFINCLIENPTFDSQTKENMTLKQRDFGSTCEIDDKMVKELCKAGLLDIIKASAEQKQRAQLAKSHAAAKRTRLMGIPKLDDANEAGGRNSHKCTLILTEGDSAKALAISGLSVVGRDHYGVFPLRGKLLNVREASVTQVMNNAEVKYLTQILGLKHSGGNKKKDTGEFDIKSLRYGRVMIMADQDQDGSHIKGLLINFFHHFWPGLLKVPNFLVQFITPIVKCTKGQQSKIFYNLPEYQQWRETMSTGWRIKYYKGLGTSTPQEAKEYFRNMNHHQVAFTYDETTDDEAINLAFNKKYIEQRKDWLKRYEPGTYLDYTAGPVTFDRFVNQELILFSMSDNARSIPSVVDGLKPGQRKILFACFKRNLKDEVKVAQLAGYVAEHSAYHHGEQSLAATIIGMAQSFVGANNVPLLEPIGQFGTRLAGGKDAASPRYIFTKLNPLARMLFHNDDDGLLNYLEEDDLSIEPEWYMPIIPMVLVNGADGIGTGWSTQVPTYNPHHVIANIRRRMEGEEMTDMIPWYQGFTGNVVKEANGKYRIFGAAAQEDQTFHITELPVRTWTSNYKEFLEELVNGGKDDDKKAKGPPMISDYKEYHTDTTVHFVVNVTADQERRIEALGAAKVFKLDTTVSTTNMVLFDKSGRLKRYGNPQEIIEEFYDERMVYYQKRKDLLAEKLMDEVKRLNNKVRFIKSVVNGDLKISNVRKKDLVAELQNRKFDLFYPKSAKGKKDDVPVEDVKDPGKGYDYLLGMPLWSLTKEKVDELNRNKDEKEEELTILLKTSAKTLWKRDLQTFEDGLNKWQVAQEAENQPMRNQPSTNTTAPATGKKRAGKSAGDTREAVAKALERAVPIDLSVKLTVDSKPKTKREGLSKLVAKSKALNADNGLTTGDVKPEKATKATKVKLGAPKAASKKPRQDVFNFGGDSDASDAGASDMSDLYDDDDDVVKVDDISDDDLDFEAEYKPTASRSRGGGAKKINSQLSALSLEDKTDATEDVSEDKENIADEVMEVDEEKPKPKPKAAPKAKRAKKTVTIVENDEKDDAVMVLDDDDGDEFKPESTKPATKTKKPAASKAKKPAAPKKKAAPKKSVDSDGDEDEFQPAATKTAAGKKKLGTKKSEPFADLGNSPVSPIRPAGRAAAKAKSFKSMFSDDDSDDDWDPTAAKSKGKLATGGLAARLNSRK
eukprot:Clim_evm42s158 gene=Clim_evmTU42s158